MTRKLPLLLPALLAAACVPVPQGPAPGPGRDPFPVFGFFTGRSEGRASLKVAFRRTVPVRVESEGHVEGANLLLKQTIFEGDKPPRDREWLITRTSGAHYAGTLSDAAGPVTGEALPGRLHLRFRMKGGLEAEQWLTLSSDGRAADNILVARKFGLPVAVLRERIVKKGEAPAGP